MKTLSRIIADPVRLAAAALVLTFGPWVLSPQPVDADTPTQALSGSCITAESLVCMTTDGNEHGYECYQGQGTDCITCIADDEFICTMPGGTNLPRHRQFSAS